LAFWVVEVKIFISVRLAGVFIPPADRAEFCDVGWKIKTRASCSENFLEKQANRRSECKIVLRQLMNRESIESNFIKRLAPQTLT
jgi:hypothetical protein